MKKKAYPVKKTIQYLLLAFIVTGFLLVFISLIFKPYYKVTINDEFIGYFKDYEEYQNCYNKLSQNIYEDDIKVLKYYTSEPIFEEVLIKTNYAKKIDNIALMNKQFEIEYVIYSIKINGEIKFYTKTNEEAEALTNELKDKVKESTEIIIEEARTRDKNLISNEQYTTDVKEQVIRENKKVTSRGGESRETAEKSYYIWPTTSTRITSSFGARWGKKHTGIDIGVGLNSNVYAVDEGKVIFAGWNRLYGYQVKIQHSDNIVTTYSHCNKVLVSAGQYINQGDIIALSGSTGNSTGPHLHFEYIINGEFKNPLNYI